MAQIVDTRNAGGEFVVLGDALTLPTASNASQPSQGSLRYNPVGANGTGAIEMYISTLLGGWTALAASGAAVSSGAGPIGLTLGETGWLLSAGLTISGDLTVRGNVASQNAHVNADTATKLATAMSLSVTGDVAGAVTFDGSSPTTLALSMANVITVAGVYTQVTVDPFGRVINGANTTDFFVDCGDY
jgi:hypothetical protein